MVEIISLSLPDVLLNQVDTIKDQQGYSGRSDVIRTALRGFLSEQKGLSELKGHADGLLMVVHKESYTSEVSSVWHAYQSLIVTQLHQHLQDHRCLELFVLRGEGSKLREMIQGLEREKKVDQVKWFVL
jgi:CopG family nickel-responsive transcriptional regulator